MSAWTGSGIAHHVHVSMHSAVELEVLLGCQWCVRLGICGNDFGWELIKPVVLAACGS